MADNDAFGAKPNVGRTRKVAAGAAITVTLLLAAGIGAGRVPAGGRDSIEGLALFTVFSVPAALALLALRSRSVLFLTAAVASGALSLLLVTAMPVLALPAAAYGVAYSKHQSFRTRFPIALVVGAPVVVALAGAVTVYGSTEMLCTTVDTATSTSTECGEVTTPTASAAGVTLGVLAVAGGWILAQREDETVGVRSHGLELS